MQKTKRDDGDDIPATKGDVRAAVAELRADMVTKDELQAAVAEIRGEVATQGELRAAVAELASNIKEQADETRRHFDVVAENIHKDVAGAAADATTLLNNQIPDHEDRITDLEKHAGLPAGPRYQHLG